LAELLLICEYLLSFVAKIAADSQIILSEPGFIGFVGFEDQDWLNLFYSVNTSCPLWQK